MALAILWPFEDWLLAVSADEAKTIRNDNSSRFGKFIDIEYLGPIFHQKVKGLIIGIVSLCALLPHISSNRLTEITDAMAHFEVWSLREADERSDLQLLTGEEPDRTLARSKQHGHSRAQWYTIDEFDALRWNNSQMKEDTMRWPKYLQTA